MTEAMADTAIRLKSKIGIVTPPLRKYKLTLRKYKLMKESILKACPKLNTTSATHPPRISILTFPL